MPNPIFKVVKAEKEVLEKELANATAYLVKATEEKHNCQQKVGNLQSKLDVFNAWLNANPDA